MNDKKNLLQSKTLWVSLAITILGALETFGWADVFSNPTTAGYVVFGIGIVMGILRKMTNKAV